MERWKKNTEKEKSSILLFTSLMAVMCKAGLGASSGSCTWVAEAQACGPLSVALPRPKVGNWIRSEATRTWMGAHKGRWHGKPWFYPICHILPHVPACYILSSMYVTQKLMVSEFDGHFYSLMAVSTHLTLR